MNRTDDLGLKISLGMLRQGQTIHAKCAKLKIVAYDAGAGGVAPDPSKPKDVAVGLWAELSITAEFNKDNIENGDCCCKTLKWKQTITSDNGPSTKGMGTPRADGSFPDGMSFRDTPIEPVVGDGGKANDMWSSKNPKGQKKLKVTFSLDVICVRGTDDKEIPVTTIEWGYEATADEKAGLNEWNVKTK
ncbi:hypothetical protein ACFQY0_20255 [Haloferula chungangensis]|uniref:Uncharacterized protein n=1 Tax=Haloferula chungangensis TaxID=1048331 RepID=A0ABW2LDF0_9BACT